MYVLSVSVCMLSTRQQALTCHAGWVPQGFAQDHPLSQACEPTITRTQCARCSEPFVWLPGASKQSCTASVNHCILGMPNLLLLEPSTVKLRSCACVTHTNTTMSSLWNKAAHNACGQGSHSGHLEQARPSHASKGQ
jgi:hypothetical protein